MNSVTRLLDFSKLSNSLRLFKGWHQQVVVASQSKALYGAESVYERTKECKIRVYGQPIQR